MALLKAFVAGMDPNLFATGTTASLPSKTSNQSETAIDNEFQTGHRMVAPNAAATRPAPAQYVPIQSANMASDNERVARPPQRGSLARIVHRIVLLAGR